MTEDPIAVSGDFEAPKGAVTMTYGGQFHLTVERDEDGVSVYVHGLDDDLDGTVRLDEDDAARLASRLTDGENVQSETETEDRELPGNFTWRR